MLTIEIVCKLYLPLIWLPCCAANSVVINLFTCWWCEWSRVCRWPRGRTRPWEDKTWWKSESRLEKWWMTCKQRLSLHQRSTQACTGKKTHTHKKNKSGSGCKNHWQLFILGTSRREKQVSGLFFVFFLCSEMSVQNNKSSSWKNSCQRQKNRLLETDSLLFKDVSLTLVLVLAPLEQVSTLPHCSSALWICHWRPSLCHPCRTHRLLSQWCC